MITPVLVVPYSKEASLVEQSFLVNGADISINNWDKVEGLTEEDIESIDGVVEATYARMYTLYMGTYQGMRMLVINTTEFLETMYQPPQSLLGFDWDSLNLLTNNTALISQSIANAYHSQIGWIMSFRHPDISEWIYSVFISGIYDLFPVFYDKTDDEEEAYMMIISVECFEAIEHIVENRLLTINKLFVKKENDRAIQEVKDEIFLQNPEIITKSYLDVIDSLKTPLYNVFIIEMIISLFVSVIILAYSSFTTSIKILERRIIKHDIMKKVGIKPSTIINTTVVQVLIAGIIPSLVIGLFVGLKLVPFSLQQMSYGAIPYPVTTVYPTMLLLVIFLGVPILVYLGMTLTLRRDFGKYSPTQLE